MPLRVVAIIPSYLPALTALINAGSAVVPPYWMFTPAQVRRVIARPAALWSPHYGAEAATVAAPSPVSRGMVQAIGVLTGRSLLAAAGITRLDDHAVLDWIAGDDPAALLALIDRLTALADGLPLRTGRTAFGGGWFGLWTGWVAAQALRSAGWQVTQRWRIYTLALANLSAAPLTVPGLKLGWHMNRASGEWTARLTTAEGLAAECAAWALPDLLDDHAAYREWILLEYLGVEPAALRRHGLAQYLLTEQARFQRERRGIRHALATLASDNTAARSLAERVGGRYVGDTVELEQSTGR